MAREILLHVPKHLTSKKIILVIDRAATDLDLRVTLRGSLKTFTGSTHWHLKRSNERGTLEITWWPKTRKLWIKIQAGRQAAWIDKATPKLKRRIEMDLHRLRG